MQAGRHLDRGQALLRRTTASTCAASRRALCRPRRAGAPPRAPRRSRSSSSRTRWQAQTKRTVFEKLREAALAYHLSHKWSKDKILTEYLNTIYFGNGAYGIESAAAHLLRPATTNCGDCGSHAPSRARTQLDAAPEAALLGGIIDSPTAYDPVAHPGRRRDAPRHSCCARCSSRATSTAGEYDEPSPAACPRAKHVQPPQRRLDGRRYFTSLGAAAARRPLRRRQRAFERRPADQDDARPRPAAARPSRRSRPPADRRHGPAGVAGGDRQQDRRGPRDGRRARLQEAARSTSPPRASASRAPRSSRSCSPQALRKGISPDSRGTSRKQVFTVPHSAASQREVRRQQLRGQLLGIATLAARPPYSDNSVFAEVGIKVGTEQDRARWPSGWASARRSRPTSR